MRPLALAMCSHPMQLNSNPLLYAAFWSATVANPEGGNPTTLTAGVNNEATVGAGTGSSYVTSRYGPAKHFVFFDISECLHEWHSAA